MGWWRRLLGGGAGDHPVSAPFKDFPSPDETGEGELESGPLAQAKLTLGMQLRSSGITNASVLRAILDDVPRERFVMQSMADRAYEDATLPIGLGQTISQPFIVALMSQLLEPDPGKSVLEIGTGCGYQAAVLARLFNHVYSIERHNDLAKTARERLRQLDCTNISVHLGDGFLGLPDLAPYDAIILTAAPRKVPNALLNQLAEGGRLVMPLELENGDQFLMRYTNSKAGLFEEKLIPVRFVPMIQGLPDKSGLQTTEITRESLPIESPKVDSVL